MFANNFPGFAVGQKTWLIPNLSFGDGHARFRRSRRPLHKVGDAFWTAPRQNRRLERSEHGRAVRANHADTESRRFLLLFSVFPCLRGSILKLGVKYVLFTIPQHIPGYMVLLHLRSLIF
jgi:hypothetical protein